VSKEVPGGTGEGEDGFELAKSDRGKAMLDGEVLWEAGRRSTTSTFRELQAARARVRKPTAMVQIQKHEDPGE
jgi:hypothetical protein